MFDKIETSEIDICITKKPYDQELYDKYDFFVLTFENVLFYEEINFPKTVSIVIESKYLQHFKKLVLPKIKSSINLYISDDLNTSEIKLDEEFVSSSFIASIYLNRNQLL